MSCLLVCMYVCLAHSEKLLGAPAHKFHITPKDTVTRANPPTELSTAWKECLLECGKQLTAILVAYHNQCHDNLLNSINKKIQEEFTAITTTYGNQIPEL